MTATRREAVDAKKERGSGGSGGMYWILGFKFKLGLERKKNCHGWMLGGW